MPLELTFEREAPAESLETALTALEARLAESGKALKVATQALKKAQDAARTGNLRDLERLLTGADDSARAYVNDLRAAQGSWSFAAESHLSSGDYLAELLEIAADDGVKGVRVLDGRLYSYPHIIRVESRDLGVRVGKKMQRGLRPSRVARMLKEAQSKPQRDNLAPLLFAIEQAYLHVTKGELGRAVRLSSIHGLLTLLPGTGRDYSLEDFVMDLYRLDLSGPHVTRSNRRFDLPASTSTRSGGGIRFATKEGEEKLYSTIRFQAADR